MSSPRVIDDRPRGDLVGRPRQRSFLGRAAQLLSSSLALDDALNHTIAAALPEPGDFGFFDVVVNTGGRRTSRAHQAPAIEGLSPMRGAPA